MGRYVGRSRGCRTCIKRKVKCDEEMPRCYQCVSSGWECPGPVEGTIFIDMSERVRRQKTRSIAEGDGERSRGKPRQQASELSGFTTLIPPSGSLGTMLGHGSKLPTSYQPDRSEIFQDLYISHFISLQDASLHPWITELPKLASSASGQSELYGIRAATMALYGRMSGNRDLELESSKWYSKGLDAQRETLPLATKPQDYQHCIHRAVGSAMMFSYFESVICTLPLGWMQHYIAATKLFEIAGPENCRAGLMHLFFRFVRVAAFTSSLTLDEPSVLASDLWCTVPFQQIPKTPFDELLDVLLQLPTCLPIRNKMRKLQETDPSTSDCLRRYLDITAKHLLRRLDEFWQQHKNQIDSNYDQRTEEIASHFANSTSAQHAIPSIHQFQSSPDAYVTSMYDAGKIIVLGCLGAASLVPNSYSQAMITHGASILASAAYCEAQGLFNGVSFSMVFPLKLLCLLSPSEEQRGLAQIALLKWGSGRGLGDICGVAAPSYLDRSHG